MHFNQRLFVALVANFVRFSQKVVNKQIGLFIAVLIGLFICSATAYAQQERIFAKAYNQEVIFCEYVASESGDNPDYIGAVIRNESFDLDAFLSSQEEYQQLSNLASGTPLEIDMVFLQYYDESGGEMRSTAGLTRFKTLGSPKPQGCRVRK